MIGSSAERKGAVVAVAAAAAVVVVVVSGGGRRHRCRVGAPGCQYATVTWPTGVRCYGGKDKLGVNGSSSVMVEMAARNSFRQARRSLCYCHCTTPKAILGFIDDHTMIIHEGKCCI
jgi:hypothetical protein